MTPFSQSRERRPYHHVAPLTTWSNRVFRADAASENGSTKSEAVLDCHDVPVLFSALSSDPLGRAVNDMLWLVHGRFSGAAFVSQRELCEVCAQIWQRLITNITANVPACTCIAFGPRLL